MKKCDEEKEIKKACKLQGECQRQRQTVSETEKREIEKQRESKTMTESERYKGINSKTVRSSKSPLLCKLSPYLFFKAMLTVYFPSLTIYSSCPIPPFLTCHTYHGWGKT